MKVSDKKSAGSTGGASLADWTHWDLILGFGADLLPIVHDAGAKPTPGSKVKKFGKIPSEYVPDGRARGIPWRSKDATPADLKKRSGDRRYSMGVRASAVRALDVDIEDPERATEVAAFIAERFNLPKRTRGNSPKFLQPFLLEGTHKKLTIKTGPGVADKIEFLADGQQFVAAGRHPSGAMYEWEGGRPSSIPRLSVEQFAEFWAALTERFSVEPAKELTTRDASERVGKLLTVITDDQLRDLKDALAWPALLQAAGKEQACMEVGYRLLTLGELGHELWTDFCANAADESDEPDAGWPEAWWTNHVTGDVRSDFRGIYKMAADLDWPNPYAGSAASVDDFDDPTEGKAPPPKQESPLHRFYAYLPSHQYIERTTRQLFPSPSVDGPLRGLLVEGLKPSAWLDKFRAVHQMTWDPDKGEVVKGQIVDEGGWIKAPGMQVYNLYRAPRILPGDPDKAQPWLDHLARVYPNDATHIIRWLAHRVQRPGDKLNHALVLGGPQGIGKDTMFEPVKVAVGRWNCNEIPPHQMLGRFNGWVKAVVVRISEARDLGGVDRFAFYDRSKTYIAAPPDVIRVDEKHLREYAVPNVMGVIITMNERLSSIYLPADDRRHYVAWSELDRSAFDEDYWNRLWGWYARGGYGHVAAYLRNVDLSSFDSKAPPPKTDTFWRIVGAAISPEETELSDLLEELGNPAAVTAEQLQAACAMTTDDALASLFSSKARRALPHKLDLSGYESHRNPDEQRGRWKVAGKQVLVYVRKELSAAERSQTVERLRTDRAERGAALPAVPDQRRDREHADLL